MSYLKRTFDIVLVSQLVFDICAVDVSSYCINEDSIELEEKSGVILTWNGDFPKGKWFPCKFEFDPYDGRICVYPINFTMPTYLTKMKYYENDDDEADKVSY